MVFDTSSLYGLRVIGGSMKEALDSGVFQACVVAAFGVVSRCAGRYGVFLLFGFSFMCRH